MKWYGVFLCSIIAVIATLLGQVFPIIGGIIFSIILGIIISNAIKLPDQYQPGIKFASKKILQYAIIVMGFTLNLRVVVAMG